MFACLKCCVCCALRLLYLPSESSHFSSTGVELAWNWGNIQLLPKSNDINLTSEVGMSHLTHIMLRVYEYPMKISGGVLEILHSGHMVVLAVLLVSLLYTFPFGRNLGGFLCSFFKLCHKHSINHHNLLCHFTWLYKAYLLVS